MDFSNIFCTVAYLDPGTGSFLLQILIAGFFGTLYAIKVFWTHIKDFFSKIFNRSPKSADRGP